MQNSALIYEHGRCGTAGNVQQYAVPYGESISPVRCSSITDYNYRDPIYLYGCRSTGWKIDDAGYCVPSGGKYTYTTTKP
jgi:hypothetical protein